MAKKNQNTRNKLTSKQKRFCEEYLIDLNATQAAIRAGYSKKTARSIGNENLTKPDVQNHLRELQNKVQERNEITIDEVVNELATIGFFDIAECYNADGTLRNVNEMSERARKAVSRHIYFERREISESC